MLERGIVCRHGVAAAPAPASLAASHSRVTADQPRLTAASHRKGSRRRRHPRLDDDEDGATGTTAAPLLTLGAAALHSHTQR